MTLPFLKRWLRTPWDSSLRGREFFRRPWLEQLEERVLLDSGLPQAIVVGRTLSSYTTSSILNNQETITYTVYNEQSNPVTGVLLTDTLQPGVTFQSASQLPDQSGQKLAWSLGTINGFDRANVTLMVSLINPIPLQLDVGAQAFATLDAGAVSDTTPAAMLRSGTVDPTLLASTPDANTTDPFIQEQAAALDYNSQNIFSFLHQNIGYNSYLGSVRGSRGTLWSNAGNALDVASLGVALMRGSGIPAQYVQGTLSSANAQSLILSMFPASYQTAGYIPAGTTTADPAHDSQLLSETEAHYWFQFDAGSGFQDADPLLSASAGAKFATPQSTFTEVPDSLREKTEITLNAEIYSQSAAAFHQGQNGSGLTTTTVLNQTFNDVDLVGRPLTVGHFVSQSAAGGLAFSTITNTYSPYLQLGDDAFDSSQDQLIRGQDYQEVLTNFPLGSQILTGLFLNFTLTGPEGVAESYSKTLVDRIGFAARQAGGTGQLAPIDSSVPPVITPFDLYTISILPGGRDPAILSTRAVVGNSAARLANFATMYNGASPDEQNALNNQAPQIILDSLIALERSEIVSFEAQATFSAGVLGRTAQVVGYPDRPRITIAATQLVSANDGSGNSTLQLGFDILKSNYRVVIAPGQSLAAEVAFNVDRGYIENGIEGSVASPPTGSSPGPLSTPIFTAAILQAAVAHGITLVTLSSDNKAVVDQLPFSADVKARMSTALSNGRIVIIPSQGVRISGEDRVGWYEIDPITGETTGILANGSHGTFDEYFSISSIEEGAAGDTPEFRFVAGFISGVLNDDVAVHGDSYDSDYVQTP
jgi:uncharacterized repeat protein (TIGR01451 family)